VMLKRPLLWAKAGAETETSNSNSKIKVLIKNRSMVQ
jgi:hypothetical protein